MHDLNEILTKHGLKLRHTADLTEQTDDPHNTCLTIFFIPFIDYENTPTERLEDKEFHAQLIKDLEYDLYNSMGDHLQELSIITQNNELILILNENK